MTTSFLRVNTKDELRLDGLFFEPEGAGVDFYIMPM